MNDWLEAYDEVRGEVARGRLPTIKQEMFRIGALPPESLYLGTCDDGNPVLLNMYNPTNILFLSYDIDFSDIENYVAAQGRVSYEVARITNSDLYGDVGGQKIMSLALWIHGGRKNVVLLVDSLDDVLKQDFNVIQNFLYILTKGGNRNVCVVTASNKVNEDWKDYFTCINQTGFRQFELAEGDSVMSYRMPETGE